MTNPYHAHATSQPGTVGANGANGAVTHQPHHPQQQQQQPRGGPQPGQPQQPQQQQQGKPQQGGPRQPQQPQQQQQQQGGKQGDKKQPSLTLEYIESLSPAEQKPFLGELLFPLVTGFAGAAGHVEHAGKITGMLLDAPPAETLRLLQSAPQGPVSELARRVREAVGALNEHLAKQAAAAAAQQDKKEKK
ncbi:Polyadenylate-binding protein/Hyperplastic disc protein [Caulochytrium protostelioides]|uniref:Polyadenylate-binding protein/Hyperplastic disc protein n=1 Tax=Caulochytrium protostelioides TaxID=1555241 RepID=A0A4P9WUV0_9FUNG|nr:Polyadenylate-binding protein/Hyperplastic disc protein [Caulochytrium protostelioides]